MDTLGPVRLASLFAISLVITLITHPGLVLGLAKGYPNDYLFNLSTGQIVGLTLISGVLAILLFLACVTASTMLCQRLRHNAPRWLIILSCTVLALLLCALALALVPQIHYLYYRLILPGLPAQWVPLGNLSLTRLTQYLLLPADSTTTVHANGATVWV